jgi:hypothetical protein
VERDPRPDDVNQITESEDNRAEEEEEFVPLAELEFRLRGDVLHS